MVTGDITREKGADPRLRVTAGLSEDELRWFGGRVCWWRLFWRKEMVEIWWCFGVCGGINGDGGGKR